MYRVHTDEEGKEGRDVEAISQSTGINQSWEIEDHRHAVHPLRNSIVICKIPTMYELLCVCGGGKGEDEKGQFS